MRQFQLFWRDNIPLQFRNTVGAEPAMPETVYADDYNYTSVGENFICINFLREGSVFLTLYEIPAYIRDLDAAIPQ